MRTYWLIIGSLTCGSVVGNLITATSMLQRTAMATERIADEIAEMNSIFLKAKEQQEKDATPEKSVY